MTFWKRIGLGTKIVIGIVLGIIIGFASPEAALFISPLGDIFLRMLKMLIVPLVFFSITSGICKMGYVKQLRDVGLRYVLWIVVSAVIASTVGLLAAMVVQPGKGTTEFLAGIEASKAASYSFVNNVISWFPTNILESMVEANLLQIIVFTLFLGIALLALGERVSVLVKVIDQATDVMLKITEYVIAFSPFGIMSLMATLVNTASGAAMVEVIKFIILDNVAALFLLFFYPALVQVFAGISTFRFMKKIATPILVAASTSSSAATLPVSIDTCREKLGIPENIYGFTLPLGNTCGMTGFAMFIGMVCIFASNLYGFPVTIGRIMSFIFLGLVISIGAAGVKGAGVVMSGVLLESLGMPLTLVPILAAIWPTIDPAHTVLNNLGDLVGTTIIAKRLGKMDMNAFNAD